MLLNSAIMLASNYLSRYILGNEERSSVWAQHSYKKENVIATVASLMCIDEIKEWLKRHRSKHLKTFVRVSREPIEGT